MRPWQRIPWLVLAVLCVVAAPASAQGVNDRLIVHYIDVGQGAATLLEFPCGAVLIDAGGESARSTAELMAYLEAVFARRADLNSTLNAVFITHTHIDHNRSLRAIAEKFTVAGYIHNGVLTGSGRSAANWMSRRSSSRAIPERAVTQVDVDAAGSGGMSDAVIDPLRCQGVDPVIRVLSGRYTANPGWPAGEFGTNGNLQSLVIRVDYGEASFLFTGDLEDQAIETLLHRWEGTGHLDVDVYAVGHHGSYNGTTQGLLTAMSPDAAVISAGTLARQGIFTAWAYGHPRRSLVEMLDGTINWHRSQPRTVVVADAARTFSSYEMTDTVYSTGWDGTVFVQTTGDGRLYAQTSR